MKLLITFTMAVFATACGATWRPSAEEVKLSAREDAREVALFKLLTTK